jgi:SAM-dependent methyltransferase
VPPEAFDAYALEYDAAVERGVRLSGEGREYFSRGRVERLVVELRALGAFDRVRRVLDHGCGTGATSVELLAAFPCLEVLGVDPSSAMVREARRRSMDPRVRFEELGDGPLPGGFDLAYAANVFHHIDRPRRASEIRRIHASLVRGGYLALFENNPWNPGALAVMARVPFDRGASPLNVLEARRLARDAGFDVVRTGSLFYFPRLLARLRPLEHFIIARKRATPDTPRARGDAGASA